MIEQKQLEQDTKDLMEIFKDDKEFCDMLKNNINLMPSDVIKVNEKGLTEDEEQKLINQYSN